ncbi:MAG: NAD(P)(+) transhydrogenase (Re/Si-specific) subunit beta [Deltaproteobacteria bacterium]|nr:NAD(P)(+) transhydrogenase (Re/Si-specific) subunit beta [Deltaproteobacteria bacterium]MDD9852339.1 NAD(P)(+) transhydrogenase (Re/Si-specific) subunit beta [Deltaproteobacteria bacterium]
MSAGETWLQLAYLASAVLFILGLRGLSSARSARRGNGMAALGMLVAVAATLAAQDVLRWEWILAGAIIGASIGVLAATRVQMTAMPEMVALLNGFGGAASALVAGAELLEARADLLNTPVLDMALAVKLVAIVFGSTIGSITLTGSLIAFGKLSGRLGGAPLVYAGQRIVNALLGAGLLLLCVWVGTGNASLLEYAALVGLALLLGVLLVVPIGGADMPVVISLLNSYSGLAACATGFVLGNSGLVISGSLVGASGLILTRIMCEAMNRSLGNVLFGAFGAAPEAAAAAAGGGASAKGYTPEDAAVIFGNASSCVVVPGYGMAVAQAQHAVRELMDLLENRGVEVQFAVHPVAGRMPGHMNVLLAEARVPYEKLVEMDDINPQFPETDVALVIGANDVVNPLAREEGSAVSGMPILDVDRARHVFVIKRSMSPGFAGIQNPLFFNDNTMMIFGDAKGRVLALVDAIKQY